MQPFIQDDPKLPKIIDFLNLTFGPSAIIFFGSRVEGVANDFSDYDVVCITEVDGIKTQDIVLDEQYLDVSLVNKDQSFEGNEVLLLKLLDAWTASDLDGSGSLLLKKAKEYQESFAWRLSDKQKEFLLIAILKNLERCQDTSKLSTRYRWMELHQMLLEGYFCLRDLLPLDERRGLGWLIENDRYAYHQFEKALSHSASFSDLVELVNTVIGGKQFR